MLEVHVSIRPLIIKHRYFDKGIFPLMRLYALFELLEQHFDYADSVSGFEFETSADALANVNAQALIPAELEVIDILIQRELYGSLLDSSEEIMSLLPETREKGRQMYPKAFQAEKRLKTFVRVHGVARAEFSSEQAVWNARTAALMNMVNDFGTFSPIEPFETTRDSAWDEYFEKHPTHEIVLPIRRAFENCKALCLPEEWGPVREKFFGPTSFQQAQQSEDDPPEKHHW